MGGASIVFREASFGRKRSLVMKDPVDTLPPKGRQRSKGLLLAVSVIGVLYLWFIIESLIPSPEGSWISTTTPFDPWDREQIFMKLLFLLFLVGYFVAWKNERIAGVILILWWVAMWGVELFVVAPIKADGGGGIAMGVPLFVLGILFWRRN
jgi:hypothetical protein